MRAKKCGRRIPSGRDSETEISMTAPKTIEDALANNARIGGSRMVSYGGMQVLVPLRDVQIAIADMQNDVDRHRVMASVRKALKRVFPRVKRGTASQKEAMECGQDIAIWFANEIIEGRDTMEIN